MSETALHYTIVIQWSDDDQVYIVSLPEWGDLIHTHGDTYEEALQRGQALLESLIQSRSSRHVELPEPRIFA